MPLFQFLAKCNQIGDCTVDSQKSFEKRSVSPVLSYDSMPEFGLIKLSGKTNLYLEITTFNH